MCFEAKSVIALKLALIEITFISNSQMFGIHVFGENSISGKLFIAFIASERFVTNFCVQSLVMFFQIFLIFSLELTLRP
jgi:hypothetical protein